MICPCLSTHSDLSATSLSVMSATVLYYITPLQIGKPQIPTFQQAPGTFDLKIRFKNRAHWPHRNPPPTPKRVDYLPCSSSGWSYTESQSEKEREEESERKIIAQKKKRKPWRYHVIPYSLAEDALHASIIHGGHHLSSSYDAHT